jgi:hypothetical protein
VKWQRKSMQLAQRTTADDESNRKWEESQSELLPIHDAIEQVMVMVLKMMMVMRMQVMMVMMIVVVDFHLLRRT